MFKTPPALSPVKSTVAKPLGDRQAFFYNPKDIGQKTDALTPGKTHVLAIRKRAGGNENKEGPVHAYLKSPRSGLIASGDSPVKHPHANTYNAEKLQLLAQLNNLKTRTDKDFRTNETGELDKGHFDATIIKIGECIKQYNKVLKLAPDPSPLILELNGYISSGRLYNPFGLKEIYNTVTGYDYKKATDPTVFQIPFVLPVTLSAVRQKSSARGLFAAFENETLAPSEAPVAEEEQDIDMFCSSVI